MSGCWRIAISKLLFIGKFWLFDWLKVYFVSRGYKNTGVECEKLLPYKIFSYYEQDLQTAD